MAQEGRRCSEPTAAHLRLEGATQRAVARENQMDTTTPTEHTSRHLYRLIRSLLVDEVTDETEQRHPVLDAHLGPEPLRGDGAVELHEARTGSSSG